MAGFLHEMAFRPLVPVGAREEERRDAVADVLADDAPRGHDPFVDAPGQPADEREVRGGRQPARQGGRGLEIDEEDRGRAAPGHGELVEPLAELEARELGHVNVEEY